MNTIVTPRPGNHDPSLPDWGPYSKKYFGISHIADKGSALRFDAFVMPQLLRRKRELPDALSPCGLIPEYASPDLSSWKCSWRLSDTIIAEITFLRFADKNSAAIECCFINDSDAVADAALHLFAQLIPEYPASVKVENALFTVEPELPAGAGVVYDSRRPREQVELNAVNHRAFKFFAGEKVCFNIQEEFAGKEFFLRYRPINGNWKIEKLSGSEFIPQEDILVDVLAVADGDIPEFAAERFDALPEIDHYDPRKIEFSYPGNGNIGYRFCADNDMTFFRRYAVEDLRSCFRYKDIVQQPYKIDILRDGSQADTALDWVVQPLHIPPHSELKRTFTIQRKGTEAASVSLPEAAPRIFSQPYARSCQRLAAVTLTNVVFPVKICGEPVRHFTPGRQWNSLYTWDSGFIGLGMLELSEQLAADILNAYLTPEGDRENAFVLHGTPLPVQIFLLLELWNRTGNKELLKTLYPGARQYYRYLAGHHPNSTTRKYCRQPLISTWDYFYNSGGWDDYPAQMEVHNQHLESRTLPVISSAVLIRCAKILTMLAKCAGFPEEKEYAQDIADFTEALLKYSWDSESGYFGYVTCDADGEPAGILRTIDGENFNKGLDGTSPLISGGFPQAICDKLWAHLESCQECFTPYGISTVDRSASYFNEEGYWNGAVWMPHQWFIWKAALDAGKGDFAWKIAETALKTYDRECESSGYCFEHFSTNSGWGGGWHHFSGLSTPVLCWHEAYYGKKRITCGFDTVLLEREEHTDRVVVNFVRNAAPGAASSVLFSETVKKVCCNGADLPIIRRGKASEISLTDISGRLEYYL